MLKDVAEVRDLAEELSLLESELFGYDKTLIWLVPRMVQKSRQS